MQSAARDCEIGGTVTVRPNCWVYANEVCVSDNRLWVQYMHTRAYIPFRIKLSIGAMRLRAETQDFCDPLCVLCPIGCTVFTG